MMFEAPVFSDPEWIIVGSRMGRRYMVFASKDLDRARLEEVMSVKKRDLLEGRMPTGSTFTITATTRDLVWAEGETYVDALQRLFNQWRPEEQPSPELEAGIVSLTETDGDRDL